jgi:hypothetical protein
MLLTKQIVNIRPGQITQYLHYDSTSTTRYANTLRAPIPKDRRTHGLISTKANRRVRNAIDWLVYLAKFKPVHEKATGRTWQFKLNFVTLTLCSKQIHTDAEIKSILLNQFLTELRTKYGCTLYLWRAESQSNGNIHFHVITDVFIPWRTLRTDWNRIQEKLGYVARYTAKAGKIDPNSTDVHSIKNIRDLPTYLSKYCSKNAHGYVVMASLAKQVPFKPKSWLLYDHPRLRIGAKFFRQIHGNLWGLSQKLSKFKAASKEVCTFVERELNVIRRLMPRKVIDRPYASLFMVNVKQLIDMGCMFLVRLLRKYEKDPDPPPRERVTLHGIREVFDRVLPRPQQTELSFN